jgi:hypothetical protein
MAAPKDHLYAGTLADFDTSDNMAKEIENAYADVRTNEGGYNDPPFTKDNAKDLRMLFIAVARGVITYLHNHPQAIQVNVQDAFLSIDGYATEIDKTP